MSDQYERLERLHRLRESGALSDREFEVEKARLLAGGGDGAAAAQMIVVVLALLGVAAILYFALRQPAETTAAAPSSNELVADGNMAATDATMTLTNAAAPAPQAPPSNYRWATSAAIIGANPDFVERRLGPPREKSGGRMLYSVDGCTITYYLAGTEVTSFAAQVSRKCNPSLDGIGRTVTSTTRLGDLARNGPIIHSATCVYMCGNAREPFVFTRVEGSHASSGIGIHFEAIEDGDILLPWSDHIYAVNGLRKGEYVDNPDIFRCPANPPPRVARNIERLRVDTVRVGRGLLRQTGCA